MTRDLYGKLGTFAATDARAVAAIDKAGDLTLAHKDELQSYLDLVKTANADVKTSTESKVRDPSQYDADAYGVVNKNNTKDASLVMKFGTEALAIANTGSDVTTSWAARNGMLNAPGYATGLMLTHVDAAAETKAKVDKQTYIPVDRYTLSYAPTQGFVADLWGSFKTKIGIDSDSVVGLRNQMESVQSRKQAVNWVVHSRGGADFVQAATGSSATNLNKSSVVFHAGANNPILTNAIMTNKEIGDVIKDQNRYRDAPNDLVPQIVGLHALSSPLNFISALVFAPCLSSAFCSIQQSPHTLPYQWNNLQTEVK